MYILLSLTAFTIFIRLLNGQTNFDSKNKKIYLIVAGIAVAIVMGLRAPLGVGSRDTEMYALAFEGMHGVGNFLNYAKRNLFENGFVLSESGFFFCMWLVSRFTANAQIFIFLTSAFMIFCVCRFIYKNSEDVAFSLLCFLTLGSFTFLMNGMRQGVAMCICLLSYEYVKKRKLIPFLIVVFIALLFHKTAFVFLIVYFFPYFKTAKSIVLYLAASVGLFTLIPRFISFYDSVIGEDYSSASTRDSGGITTLLVYLLAIALALLVFKKFEDQSDKNSFYATLTGAALYIARFVTNQMVERVSYFFFLFVILLLPNAIQKLGDRDRQLMKFIVGVAAVALFAYRLSSGSFSNFHFYF